MGFEITSYFLGQSRCAKLQNEVVYLRKHLNVEMTSQTFDNSQFDMYTTKFLKLRKLSLHLIRRFLP